MYVHLRRGQMFIFIELSCHDFTSHANRHNRVKLKKVKYPKKKRKPKVFSCFQHEVV